ncbi:tRNA pseudouridine(38-40) synthase TruA [Helicobacter muridarum]|uniref:tRNA pseudouridine synthase A n=1 Tax=Helicobacter muridarum TaxID=216 RepID=A0A377PUG7_9HELI|nr:tRNA pseudouridine(38-40) synthase TruA [Helicobacter muridarum]TLE00797.1 tRNA pseudouridine(38-40) synthase TruA [Helicobacter muridarum]STQ86516.1 tRNA pseudouridine synthase A [Helicobacter muridarum]
MSCSILRRNIACIIAYDGSKFYGFARQNRKDTDIVTVVEFFENALRNIGISTYIIGSGRTDRGVHATYQVINFHANLYMSLSKMRKLLNDRLYPFVLIKQIYEVGYTFHARFDAKARFYKYIFTKEDILPFYTNYIARLDYGDVNLLKLALLQFMGEHDFTLFKKSGSYTKHCVREIIKANIFPAKIHNISCLVAHIGANGFLRSQVRLILQACIYVSLNKIRLRDIINQISNNMDLQDRRCVRKLVPACGLYLTKVIY